MQASKQSLAPKPSTPGPVAAQPVESSTAKVSLGAAIADDMERLRKKMNSLKSMQAARQPSITAMPALLQTPAKKVDANLPEITEANSEEEEVYHDALQGTSPPSIEPARRSYHISTPGTMGLFSSVSPIIKDATPYMMMANRDSIVVQKYRVLQELPLEHKLPPTNVIRESRLPVPTNILMSPTPLDQENVAAKPKTMGKFVQKFTLAAKKLVFGTADETKKVVPKPATTAPTVKALKIAAAVAKKEELLRQKREEQRIRMQERRAELEAQRKKEEEHERLLLQKKKDLKLVKKVPSLYPLTCSVGRQCVQETSQAL
jgi:hypothetical protein